MAPELRLGCFPHDRLPTQALPVQALMHHQLHFPITTPPPPLPLPRNPPPTHAPSPGGGCLRNLVCAHCANTALQLDRAPGCRFPDAAPPGSTTCLICRDTRVDARTLTPASAYALNHNVMAIADALGMQAECRWVGWRTSSRTPRFGI